MTARKHNFKDLTDEQLKEIQESYPNAVETVTIIKPVYSKMAMLVNCNVMLANGRRIADVVAKEGEPNFLKSENLI